MLRLIAAVFAGVLALGPGAARGQNPIQWQGNPRAAIERAGETLQPLMFWVTQRQDIGDDDELEDAQEESFRDPQVVAIAESRYIPVRIARNSRNEEEARRLGLPDSHGLYIALVTPDGRLLEMIDPGQVASPEALAQRLSAASRRYLDELYAAKLRPVIVSSDASKSEVRRAVQAVWRLGITAADRDCVALLDRGDLTQPERAKLEGMLAAMATEPCISALLGRAEAGDKDAARALLRAEPGALPTLLAGLPGADETEPTAPQLAAYRAAARLVGTASPRPDAWWKTAKAADRTAELDRLRTRAEPIYQRWQDQSGKWR